MKPLFWLMVAFFETFVLIYHKLKQGVNMITKKPEQVVFSIPLPPRECSPNFHGHWRRRHEATKTYRAVAKRRYKTAMVHLPDRARQTPIQINAEFFCGPTDSTVYTYKPLDIQNAIGSLKAAVDGFIDAGAVPDDSYKWVRWGEVVLRRTKRAHKGRAEVVIMIQFDED